MNWKMISPVLRDTVVALFFYVIYALLLFVISVICLSLLGAIDKAALFTPESRVAYLVMGLTFYIFLLRSLVTWLRKKDWALPGQNLVFLPLFAVVIGSTLLRYKDFVPTIPEPDMELIKQLAYTFMVIVPSVALGNFFSYATEHDPLDDIKKSLDDIQTTLGLPKSSAGNTSPDDDHPTKVEKLATSHRLAEPTNSQPRNKQSKPQNKNNRKGKRRR